MPNFMINRLLGAELFRADGRTDEWTDGHTESHRYGEANSRFSQFANAHKKIPVLQSLW